MHLLACQKSSLQELGTGITCKVNCFKVDRPAAQTWQGRFPTTGSLMGSINLVSFTVQITAALAAQKALINREDAQAS